MKLNLGEKLRNLRKNANMTQEQLADRLGVSYQAVSRWENQTAYPDLELIPALAEFFGVTSDFLLCIPEEKKEQEAKEIFTRLVEATCQKEPDPGTIIRLIREIRLNYLKSKHLYHFWTSARQAVYRMPEILPEVRITVETILEGDFSRWDKETAIEYFACLESDERIDDFLNRYASGKNMSKESLLHNRYSKQKWTQKGNLLRQDLLMEHIDQLIGGDLLWRTHDPAEEDKALDSILHQKNTLCLTLLHQLCGAAPDKCHPISGNGTVDIWIEPRLRMGIHEFYFFSHAGDYENAFLVLEDTVCLLEKAMGIAAPTTLTCTSPWLKDIQWTAEENWDEPYNYLPSPEEERLLFLHNNAGCCYCIYPSVYYRMLTVCENSRQTECLALIGGDERFKALADRIQSLIVTRPVQKTQPK